MSSTVYIEEQLRGMYPTSQKINAMFIAEMGSAFGNLSDNDFDEAMSKHRMGENGSRLPTVKSLLGYAGKVSYSDRRLSAIFLGLVLGHGWQGAIHMVERFNCGQGFDLNQAVNKWMVRCGINEHCPEFYGMSADHIQFVRMIHDGEIAEAHRFMELATPDENGWYRQRADSFTLMGNEAAKLYFYYHRSENCRKVGKEFELARSQTGKPVIRLKKVTRVAGERAYNNKRNEQLGQLREHTVVPGGHVHPNSDQPAERT